MAVGDRDEIRGEGGIRQAVVASGGGKRGQKQATIQALHMTESRVGMSGSGSSTKTRWAGCAHAVGHTLGQLPGTIFRVPTQKQRPNTRDKPGGISAWRGATARTLPPSAPSFCNLCKPRSQVNQEIGPFFELNEAYGLRLRRQRHIQRPTSPRRRIMFITRSGCISTYRNAQAALKRVYGPGPSR